MALCDKCLTIVSEQDIRAVCTARPTRSSPAEYSEWCAECCGEDRDEDYERANLRYKERTGSEL
jgi:hypothetical protein